MDLIIDRVHEHSTGIAPTQPHQRYKDVTTAFPSFSECQSPPFSTIRKPNTVKYHPSLNILSERTRLQTNIISTTQPIHTLQFLDTNPTTEHPTRWAFPGHTGTLSPFPNLDPRRTRWTLRRFTTQPCSSGSSRSVFRLPYATESWSIEDVGMLTCPVIDNCRTTWKRLPTILPISLARNSYKRSLNTVKLRQSHVSTWVSRC